MRFFFKLDMWPAQDEGMTMKKATAADRFALGAALIESSNVLVPRQVAQDWAPRHGTYATPGLGSSGKLPCLSHANVSTISSPSRF